jgi:hypothetical protein
MEAEVNRVRKALEEGNMAGIMHGHRVLKDQLENDSGGLDAVRDGEKVSWDPTGIWQQKVEDLTKEVMEKSDRYMERGTDEDDGPLLPLRRAMGGIADLAQAITELEAEPNEANLKLLGRDLNETKNSLMLLGRVLMLSQDSTLVASAHALVAEAKEAIQAGQQRVRATLRRLEAASDISETGSVGEPICDGRPIPERVVGGQMPSSSFTSSRWRLQAAGKQGGDMADLIRCLSGAQANNNGWAMFKGVEYPRFRKEWWATEGHTTDMYKMNWSAKPLRRKA